MGEAHGQSLEGSQDRAASVAPLEVSDLALDTTIGDQLHHPDLQGFARRLRVIPDIGHGFGAGHGTAAEGWITEAAAFWQHHLPADAMHPMDNSEASYAASGDNNRAGHQ